MLITLLDNEKKPKIINTAHITQLIECAKGETSVCLIDTSFVMTGKPETIKNLINRLIAELQGELHGETTRNQGRSSEESSAATEPMGKTNKRIRG